MPTYLYSITYRQSQALEWLALLANEPVPTGAAEEALQAARASGNPFAIGLAIQNAAGWALMAGQPDEAYRGYEEAARIYQQMRDQNLYNASRSGMGHVRRKQGRLPEAVDLYRETLPVWQETGQRAAVAHDVESLGFIAQANGQMQRAATILGAAEAERERLRSPMTPFERREYDQIVATLRAQLAPTEMEAAWAAGRAMGMDEAIEYALSGGPEGAP